MSRGNFEPQSVEALLILGLVVYSLGISLGYLLAQTGLALGPSPAEWSQALEQVKQVCLHGAP